jgi:prevent-host-death family protein
MREIPDLARVYLDRNLDKEAAELYINVQYREQAMKQISFTEFRRNAAALFNAVEQGEKIRVLRHGKPIAEIVPVERSKVCLSWKRPGLLLEAGDVSLSREILKERERARK